jgi:hypothetical protein
MIYLIIESVMLQCLWCCIVEMVLRGIEDWKGDWDIPSFDVRLRFYIAYVLFRVLPFPW